MANLLKDIDYTKFIGQQESQNLLPALAFGKELNEIVSGDQKQTGLTLPWPKTTDYVRLRPGEVSLWSGISGHGKSHLLGQIMSHLLIDEKCLIASMEIKPQRTLYYMLRQISAGPQPTTEFSEYFLNWTNDRLWIYDQIDTVETERVLGMCWYAGQELGVKHIVIDSLMKCGMSDDDYSGQKEFVDHLCWAAKSLDIHIHLVSHIRKTDDEFNVPGKWDVLGSSSITNLVDNVFIVHRNKRKERMLESDLPQADWEAVDRQHDTAVSVCKQRHGEWEGNIFLWYDNGSQAFTERHRGTWDHSLLRDYILSKDDTQLDLYAEV